MGSLSRKKLIAEMIQIAVATEAHQARNGVGEIELGIPTKKGGAI